jgi:microcystin-dependent protein
MPYIGEIHMFAYTQPDPTMWIPCDGQLLPIAQNQALFSLLGTTFGGNGQTTFAVPDFRGRVPIHPGQGFSLGQSGGEEGHALTVAEMPAHTHALNVSTTAATSSTPDGNLLATASASLGDVYGNVNQPAPMAAAMISADGNGLPHENMQPYGALVFMIAINGLFPNQ